MLKRAAYWTIVFTLPVVLLMLASRIVMTPTFLTFEYTRAGFPPDRYGFTVEDRLLYGPLGLQSLLEQRPISFLAEQTLPGDRCFPPQATECPMFNERELQHMVDVQNVTWMLFTGAGAAAALCAIAMGVLWRQRLLLLAAVDVASIALIVAVLTAAVAVVFAWDVFFDTFHALFFEDGTWRFFYSDTLIRLYPEQFWIDAAVAVGALSVTFAVVILALTRWYRGRSQRQDET
jgi:integral membrane protein (TIGR01906 family)